jgi:hypothetical protein
LVDGRWSLGKAGIKAKTANGSADPSWTMHCL